MLSPQSLRSIESSQGWRQHRIEMFDLADEGAVVVKGQRPARGPLRFRILAGLSALTRNPLLRPVPSPGGRAAQQTELRRLHQLASAGVRVPEVIHVSDDFLVLRRVQGESLQNLFERDAQQAMEAFEAGLEGLHEVHQRHQYLSQGFARNILLQQGQLWFIDFEDDPLQAMSLADAQTRDIFAYLLSAIWVNRAPRAELMQAWSTWIGRCTADMQRHVRRATSGLAWMRHLPSKRKPWGRDVVTVQALAEFLYHWNTSEPAL